MNAGAAKRWCRRGLVAAFGVIVVYAGVLLLAGGEPRSGGRKLSSWLQQHSMTGLDEVEKRSEAERAIRAVGARRALPTVLGLLETRESPLRSWIIEKAEGHSLKEKLHLRSAVECQLAGLAGFEVLGTNGAAAVGELASLLDDKELGFLAARCLDSIGKPAEQALCRCLTNGDDRVRSLSVWALTSATDDVEVYLNRIRPLLNDADATVRFATVQAVAAQNEAPDLAVPILIPALLDSADSVCEQAANGLAGFNTNALVAIPALTNLASTGREGQRRTALKALA
jgi:HEAT repeat protein